MIKLKKTKENEVYMLAFFRAYGLPNPILEYGFALPERKWRFDFCWKEQMIALEVEGGIWNRGAHVRGKHFLSDVEKYNFATLMGWRVFRCTPQQFQKGEICELLKKAFLKNPLNSQKCNFNHSQIFKPIHAPVPQSSAST